jgi:Secretion system C-terminal sorting domain
MKKMLFVFFVIIFQNIDAQISFQKIYNKDSIADYAQSVVQADDAGFYTTGVRVRKVNTIFYGEALLQKTDKFGNEIWTKYYATPRSNDLTFDNIQKTSDNKLILTGIVNYGIVNGSGDYDVYLTKCDLDGNVLWSKNYGGSLKQRGLQVKETYDKGFVIGGWSEIGSVTVPFLIKTNSVGDTLWTKKYINSPTNSVHTIIQTKDSGYIMAGSNSVNIFVMKTDVKGETLWTKSMNNLGNSNTYDIAVANNGNFIIAGYGSNNNCLSAPLLMELDQSGNILWTKIYDNGACGWIYSISKTSDNGYALFGMDGQYVPYLIKTDANGVQQWYQKFDLGNVLSYGTNLRTTSDNGFIMTGYASGNIFLIKTNENGDVLTDLKNLNLENYITIYPNPTNTSEINVKSTEKANYTLMDLSGKVLDFGKLSEGNNTLQLNSIQNGMYLLKVNQQSFKSVVNK